jgi:hypothetical protein
MLGIVTRQQWKLSRQLRGQVPLKDARLSGLLAECQAQLGIKRRITFLAVSGLNTPALFGQFRPRVLIPQEILEWLDDRELRFVLLHELTHLQRRDILVNWAAIIIRALHWFNPAVWLALKRLRADQELACDAAVMARLAADDRKFYGHTLIKLVEDFSAARLGPGLASFITNKQNIKRRIAMISKFKPASRFAFLGSIVLLLALCGFTFTRAADKSREAPKLNSSTNNTPTLADTERLQRLNASERKIMVLQEKLDEMSGTAGDEQNEMSRLRKELDIPNDIAEGTAVSKMDSETMRRYDELLMNAESDYVREEALLSKLKSLPRDELKIARPTAAPDAILSQLLQDEIAAEQNLAKLRGQFGENNPEVVSAVKFQAELDKQMDARIKGVIQGMDTRAGSLKAVVDNLKEKINEARKSDNDSFEKYRPYFRIKRDLETLHKSRDALMARLDQEKIDFEILKADPPH